MSLAGGIPTWRARRRRAPPATDETVNYSAMPPVSTSRHAREGTRMPWTSCTSDQNISNDVFWVKKIFSRMNLWVKTRRFHRTEPGTHRDWTKIPERRRPMRFLISESLVETDRLPRRARADDDARDSKRTLALIARSWPRSPLPRSFGSRLSRGAARPGPRPPPRSPRRDAPPRRHRRPWRSARPRLSPRARSASSRDSPARRSVLWRGVSPRSSRAPPPSSPPRMARRRTRARRGESRGTSSAGTS